MKVFLTGVTGFLGSHIAEALCAGGHEVVALARDPGSLHAELRPLLRGDGDRSGAANQDTPATRPPPSGIAAGDSAPPSGDGRLVLVRGSLFDPEALRTGCRGVDAVVHVAGLIQARSESVYRRVNVEGTERVLSAAIESAPQLRRFVHISSQAAGGPARDGSPLTGLESPHPISSYGRTKLGGEQLVLARAAQVPVTILRPPVVFGARDRMLGQFFRAVARGRAIVWGDGSNAFNVVHAPDVARAVVRSLDAPHPTGSILYTGDDRVFTWRSFIEALAAVTGARVRIMGIPPVVFVAAAALSTAVAFVGRGTPAFSFDKITELREPAWMCSSQRTRDILEWAPRTSVEEALVATHDWYRRAGQL